MPGTAVLFWNRNHRSTDAVVMRTVAASAVKMDVPVSVPPARSAVPPVMRSGADPIAIEPVLVKLAPTPDWLMIIPLPEELIVPEFTCAALALSSVSGPASAIVP